MSGRKGSSSPDEKPSAAMGEYGLNIEASQPAEVAEFNLANQHDQLARGLKSRHIQFLALGKCLFFFAWAFAFAPCARFFRLGICLLIPDCRWCHRYWSLRRLWCDS